MNIFFLPSKAEQRVASGNSGDLSLPVLNTQVDKLMNRQIYRQMDRQTDGWMDWQIDRLMDRWMETQKYRWKDEWMDRFIDG